MIDLDEAPPPPTLAPGLFDRLQEEFQTRGPLAAIDSLCDSLRELGDYQALFYALLMRKRVELGVAPFPTGNATEIPSEHHEAYENAIRDAGRYVGKLYLEKGDFARAWFFFRMLDEPAPVVEAIEQFQFDPDQDCQALIEVALYQGVHPKRGFELALERYGICSAITIFSSQDWSKNPEAKEHSIAKLVASLYEQLRERLRTDIEGRGETAPEDASVVELLRGREYLTADGAYHIDTSHLSSVVQFALELTSGPALGMARQLCAYGERLSTHFQHEADPPFEKTYSDYRVLMEIFDGHEVEAGLKHFRDKIDPAYAEGMTFPAEVYVNILVRLNRPREALAVAKKYLADVNRQTICPSVYELCQKQQDYQSWSEAAKTRADGVNFLASLIAMRGTSDQSSVTRHQ
jgi:hypothetical protein